MRDISILFEGGSKRAQKKKRVTFYAICVTFAIMVILTLILAVYGVVSWISDSAAKTPDGEDTVSIGATTTVTLSQQDIYSGDLLLLDASHPLIDEVSVSLIRDTRPKNEAGNFVYSILGTNTLSLRSDALKQFNAMAEAFYKQSKDDNLIVFNAYDPSKSSQAAIYEAGTTVALGYYSQNSNKEYVRNESIYGIGTYNWIYNNAHRYGFVLLSSEAQTDEDGKSLGSNVFRYVGIPHAVAMSTKRLSFERYLEYLKEKTYPDAPLAINASAGKYAIYYLSATDAHTVPTQYQYDVSGNNVDGYIITVDLSKKIS